MEPFSPAHQPDEGYSEDPLNPSNSSDQIASALSSLRSSADLPQWVIANSSLLPVSMKAKLATALLDQLPTSAILEIVERLSPRLYIDFIRHLPAEICLKILGYLDSVSLVSVLRTCRAWYDLGIDRKLWKNLYHQEGWKAILGEIEAWEVKVNIGLKNSIGHLHRAQLSDGHAAKYRAIVHDEDLEMTDDAGPSNFHRANDAGSIFGSPASSFFSNRHNMSSPGDANLGQFSAKGKGVDRGLEMPEGRAKRKEPGGTPEVSLPPIVQADDISSMMKSSLWMWDITTSEYRANWKHIYNMRRRLESNWELGKYTTFVLPHPDHPEEGHQECVYTLQFDDNYLVSGSRDRTMRVWNMHTRRLVRPPLQGHSGSVLCLQFDADPSEDILVSGSSDSNVFIWKFSTGELVQKITKAHRESVLNVRFDKRILVTSSKDKTIKIFNRKPTQRGRLIRRPDQGVDPVGVSVKAYGYEPDMAQELPLLPPYTMIGKLEGHGAAVNAIQVRGNTIVSVSGDRQIKLWNWPEQVCVQTIPAHDKGIACVEFDERRIVSGSSDYEVCIFDALTGLKVASLRGHTHLVRTVQAGFADLPYSKTEDALEAKRVDGEYFRAVEAGEIDHEGDRRLRRGRRTNAGSSRPADLQAYGAKVPPGGGGGRKYGRIVSGSYDQRIIVWRRDKEGVWKPSHHLRQEEAAEAAYRQAASSSSEVATPRPARHGSSQSQDKPPVLPQITYNQDAQSAHLLRGIIDQVIPLGVTALKQALSNHPGMLIHHSYLQTMIEQEPSPIIRMQMRQTVADALIAIQNSQSSKQRPISGMPPELPPNASAASTRHSRSAFSGNGSSSANLYSSRGSTQSAGTSSSSSSNSHSNNSRQTIHPNSSTAGHTNQPQTAPAPAAAPVPVLFPVQVPPNLAQGSQPQASVHGALASAITQLHHSQPAAQGTPNATVAVQAPPSHPRFTETEYSPARVFKLQFDARKIICCTQASIIVGWDFCNGDAELEEVARFFATVD